MAGEIDIGRIGSRPSDRRKSWLLLILSVIMSLAGGEIYLRFTSPHIIRKNTAGPVGREIMIGDFGYFDDTFRGRRHIPNSHVVSVWGDGFKIPIDINAYGFRDVDFPLGKRAGETRILMLGDSVTFGARILPADTYAKRSEFYLNKEAKRGVVRCINGGVEGIGLKDEIDILIEQGLAISPDIVVFGFFLNDGMPPDRLAAGLANPGFVRRHSILAQTVFRAYKLYRYRSGKLKEAMMYEWMNERPPEDWRRNRSSFLRYASTAEKDWGSAWVPGTWRGIEEQMNRLQHLAKEHRFDVVFVCFPVSFQVDADYVEDGPQRRLKSLTEKYHFLYFDLLPVLRHHAVGGGLFEDHCHLTRRGHNIVGEALSRYLSEVVL